MAPYVDFHTHLRRGDALEILNVDALDEAAVRAAMASECPFSLGIHPWHAAATEEQLSEALARVENGVVNSRFVVVGECGLDFAVEVDREVQRVVFERQVRLARRLSRPIVLHCVRAFEEVMNVLRTERVERAVFHSFIGSVEQAKRVAREGYVCSFSPRSLASPRTCEAIRQIALSALLVERDESAQPIEEIYEQIATLRGCSAEELRTIVFENYKRLIDNE